MVQEGLTLKNSNLENGGRLEIVLLKALCWSFFPQELHLPSLNPGPALHRVGVMVLVSHIKALKFRRPGNSLQVRGLQVSELSFVPRTPPSHHRHEMHFAAYCHLLLALFPHLPIKKLCSFLTLHPLPPPHMCPQDEHSCLPWPPGCDRKRSLPEPRRSGRAGRTPLIPPQPPSGPGTWPRGTGLTRWEGGILQTPRTCTPLPTVLQAHLQPSA